MRCDQMSADELHILVTKGPADVISHILSSAL